MNLPVDKENGSEPYLSICIPTYNRAECLAKCLESIVSQLPLEKSIEICISDNASTDNTREIAEQYAQQYPFIHYRCNATNIGADRNIHEVPSMAKGKFIKPHGDDDYFRPAGLAILLRTLQQNEDCSLLYINTRMNDLAVRREEGHSAYVRAATFFCGFISAFVMRREDLMAITLTDKYMHTHFQQIYLQYLLLEHNPKFCVLNCKMFFHGQVSSVNFGVGEVIIEGYQAIMREFIGKGLSEEEYERECKESIYQHVIPYIPHYVKYRQPGHVDNFREIYIKHYKDKPYFEEGLALINVHLP